MQPVTKQLLTSTQVAALLGKSSRTITRMADAGTLPTAGKLPGPNGAYLFDRDDIEPFRAEREAALRAELALVTA